MRERWLVLAEEAFLPPDAGGRVETLNFLQALHRAGIELTVIVPGECSVADTRYRAALPGAEFMYIPRRVGWRAHLSPTPYIYASRPCPAWLPDEVETRHRWRAFTAMVSGTFRVAHLGIRLARRIDVPHIVRPHNVESEYFARLARAAPRWRAVPYVVEALKVRRAERRIHNAPEITGFADLSYDDCRTRSARTRRPVVVVPPFLPPAATGAQSPAPAKGWAEAGQSTPGNSLLFVGSLDTANNVDGIRWFADRCWPLVRGQRPETTWQIVGRRPTSELREDLARVPGVTLIADAPTLSPYLASASVVINPVRRGAGVNIKMIDAMSAGAAVVSTTQGARGLPWSAGRHLLIADAPDEFAAAVDRLLADDELRGTLGRAARDFIRTELDVERSVARLLALLAVARATDLQHSLRPQPLVGRHGRRR